MTRHRRCEAYRNPTVEAQGIKTWRHMKIQCCRSASRRMGREGEGYKTIHLHRTHGTRSTQHTAHTLGDRNEMSSRATSNEWDGIPLPSIPQPTAHSIHIHSSGAPRKSHIAPSLGSAPRQRQVQWHHDAGLEARGRLSMSPSCGSGSGRRLEEDGGRGKAPDPCWPGVASLGQHFSVIDWGPDRTGVVASCL